MTTHPRAILWSTPLILVLWILAMPQKSNATAPAQITVLYDASGKVASIQKDWGYAALVEYGGKRILFDTGSKPEILAQNAKTKGVDLTKLDFVVMSSARRSHGRIDLRAQS